MNTHTSSNNTESLNSNSDTNTSNNSENPIVCDNHRSFNSSTTTATSTLIPEILQNITFQFYKNNDNTDDDDTSEKSKIKHEC